ncbi:haloacid dehalogenase, type II [Xylariaceae sp. FL0804]|nr:haloacid dehalogenase, type II [Xylariaceae sp. FL0804]
MAAADDNDAAQLRPTLKALTFDVFGTVVDWRTSVTQELVDRARAKVSSLSSSSLSSEFPSSAAAAAAAAAAQKQLTSTDYWAAFAQAWRDSYMAFTRGYDPDAPPDAPAARWKDVDAHHRDSLAELLAERGLLGGGLRLYDDAELDDLSRVWHRLRPWPDSASGLRRLRGGGLVTATLSNGNGALLRDLDAHGGLGFQRLISAADFGAYKPHPRTYRGAVEALGCEPHEVAMVAAHLSDLAAARSHGLRTVYVERPGEEAWRPDEPRYREARAWVDVWIGRDEGGLVELARRLGMAE